jgi:hypothetical protein
VQQAAEAGMADDFADRLAKLLPAAIVPARILGQEGRPGWS